MALECEGDICRVSINMATLPRKPLSFFHAAVAGSLTNSSPALTICCSSGCALQEETQPAIMARTNDRNPNDRRPLPRGIRPIPPLARPPPPATTRSAPQGEAQPAIMARTNIRRPTDHRPLPRGIGAIPPPPRPCTRASTRAATLASIRAASIRAARRRARRQPKPPTVAEADRLAARNAQRAEQDRLVVISNAHVRDNMVDYESRYPSAVQVRNRLGAAVWEHLEFERCRHGKVAYFIRQLDREGTCPPGGMDKHLPMMKAYVRRACGEYVHDIFNYYHDNLQALIVAEEVLGLGIQGGTVMSEIREMFHRKPYMWCAYNSFFPVKGRWGHAGRMNWEQLKDWMIWTLKHPMEEASWFSWMRPEDRVPLKQVTFADTIFHTAMIEVIEDVAARMGALY